MASRPISVCRPSGLLGATPFPIDQWTPKKKKDHSDWHAKRVCLFLLLLLGVVVILARLFPKLLLDVLGSDNLIFETMLAQRQPCVLEITFLKPEASNNISFGKVRYF